MIAGATRGAGGAALGHHLGRADTNECVIVGESRGLVSEGIREQVEELTRLGSHARTSTPLLHMHADPPAGRPWTDEERARYWELMEDEFGLEGRPFASVIHVKDGREHEHKVWLRVRPDGTAIRMDHDHARREKVSRIMEWERGEPFTKGAHNRAVIAALRTERPEVAAAMEAAGLHEGPRPRAAVTPTERLQQDRTGVSKKDVAACVAQAWAASDSGSAFAAALAEHGLVLARGDRRGGMPVVVDATGNTHAVTRMLGMAARSDGMPALPAADVAARLDGMMLPSVAEARQAIPTIGPDTPSDAGPPTPDATAPPGSGQDAPGSTDVSHAHIPMGHAEAAPAHAAAQDTPGAALDDAGPGPGEPPGPAASPEELTRFRARLAAYDDRKAAAWARWVASQRHAAPSTAPSGGGYHGSVQQAVGWTPAVAPGHAAREARAAIHATNLDGHARRLACEQDSSHGRDDHGTGDEQRHDRAGGGDGPAARGNDRGHAQADGRGVEPVARPGSAAAGRDAEPDNGNPVHPDGGAGIAAQDRAAAGGAAAHARQAVARRAAEVRLAHGLAGQQQEMDRMRQARQELDPTWRDARDTRRRIHADQARIDAILATHPHLDPASSDPAARADAYAHAISERTRQCIAAVDAAQAQATAAFQGRSRGTRFLAFMGIATAEQRQAERLVAHAEALAAGAADTMPSRDDYRRARASGEAHAYAAQQTTAAWEARPEVAQAMEKHRLNQAVQQAVQVGDPVIAKAVDAGGPDAARAVIRAREQEEERCQAEQERLEQLRRGPPGHGGTRPPPGRK